MTDVEIDLLAERVAIKSMRFSAPVLNVRESLAYVGKRSESAFYVWADKWSVVPCDTGRYSRALLDTAMRKEARMRKRKS
jgi:hypothetical protein